MADAERFTPWMNNAMVQFEIDSPNRVAAFLANVSIESARLGKTKEDLYYRDPARLVSIYPRAFKTIGDAVPYTKNSKALGDLLYKGYSGRGCLMLTWRENYQAASNALGFDYVSEPELVEQPEHAALTAAWFWASAGCNTAADRGDMGDVRRRVNGPRRLHLAETVALFNATQTWLT